MGVIYLILVYTAQTSHCERKLVVLSGIEAYETSPDFFLLRGKYWFNLQTVSEKKFSFDLKSIVGGIISCSDIPEIRQGRETAPLPLTAMHFVLPTSGHDLPCAVPKFTGIHAVTAQPAYSVYNAKKPFLQLF